MNFLFLSLSLIITKVSISGFQIYSIYKCKTDLNLVYYGFQNQ